MIERRDHCPSDFLVPKDATSLHSNNFDAIRLGMAILVVWSHSFALYFGSENSESLSRLTNGHYNSGNVAVSVFFIISGFLVSRSYFNSASLSHYFNKRVRRIYPGYLAATSICAFIIIPVFSSASLSALPFSEIAKTVTLNVLLQNYFPPSGVFAENMSQTVNGSLWSIAFEFWCYIGIAFMGFARIFKWRVVLLLILVTCVITRSWLDATGRKPGGGLLGDIIGWPYIWFSILPCFMSGMVIYLYRDLVRRNKAYLILLTSGFFVACFLPIDALLQKIAADLIFPFAASYFIFYFAFIPSPFQYAGKLGDFSFGTYLYAFPIQQMLLASYKDISFAGFVSFSVALALSAGVLSWLLFERWFLSRGDAAQSTKSSEKHS
jgi:peptidoglycan/LPS O-acetylase OafA/YrhL